MTSRTAAELVEALKTHHPEAEVVPLSRIAAGDVVLVQHNPIVQWAEVVATTEHGEEGAFFHFIKLTFAQWVAPQLRPAGVPMYRLLPVAADSWKERNEQFPRMTLVHNLIRWCEADLRIVRGDVATVINRNKPRTGKVTFVGESDYSAGIRVQIAEDGPEGKRYAGAVETATLVNGVRTYCP